MRHFKNTETDEIISIPESEIEIIYNMYGFYTKNEEDELEPIPSSAGYWFDSEGREIEDATFSHGAMIDRHKPVKLYDDEGNELPKIDSDHYQEVYIHHTNGWRTIVLSDSIQPELVTFEEIETVE